VSVESNAVRAMAFVARRPALGGALFLFSKWGNPFAEERNAWPYSTYDKMQSKGYVFYSRLYRQWFVFGHDEAQQVLRSSHASTKSAGQVILELPDYQRLSPEVRDAVGRFLLILDPPDHTRLRSAVSRAFTPRASAAHETAVREVVTTLIEAIPTHGEVDLVEAFTARLPIHVIGSLLGLPQERFEWLRGLSKSIGSLLEPIVGIDPAQVNKDTAELFELFRTTIDDRRRSPRNDIVSALVSRGDDGELTDDEVLGMIGFLLFAGHETVTGALGNALVALEQHPHQRRLLLERPDLISGAVEELLRYDSSVQQTARTTSGPIDVGGLTIPAKAVVGVFLGAANRDRRRWPDADCLDITRVNDAPVMFGHGIHHCLGAALARLQMRVALPPLLQRIENRSIELSRVEWKRSFVLRGPTTLPSRVR
jgi:cytochrome P450